MVEVGRGLWRSSVQRGHLDQVALNCVQMAFEQLQGQRFHSFSGQSVPVLSKN